LKPPAPAACPYSLFPLLLATNGKFT
jgi:hypothetical protein